MEEIHRSRWESIPEDMRSLITTCADAYKKAHVLQVPESDDTQKLLLASTAESVLYALFMAFPDADDATYKENIRIYRGLLEWLGCAEIANDIEDPESM